MYKTPYDKLGGYGIITREEHRKMGNDRINARFPNRQSKLTVKGKACLFLRLNRESNVSA